MVTTEACYLLIGVEVATPDGNTQARVILLNCSVDLPARSMLMNMKQWNGAFGCLYCEAQGTVLDGDHLHRYWPQQEASVAVRTHESLLRDAERATLTKTVVCIVSVL